MKFLSIAFVLFNSIQSKNYLLTPKENEITSTGINMNAFANEHALTVVAQIDDLTVYKVSDESYNTFRNTFNDLFDVEEDQKVTLPRYYREEDLVSFDEIDLKLKMNPVPWHLDRIAKRGLPLTNEYIYNSTGSCHQNKAVKIDTYVVDTGIDVNHPEFEGRATWLANFADSTDTDCNSHGTHCAGLVGSKSYGVCKDANLFAVKVLDCEGSGSYSGILAGLDFVYKRHLDELKKNSGTKSIVSMSLGGGYSGAINKVVQSLIKNNAMFVVVAAGNENADACKTSPASAIGVLTIMASDKYDKRAYFSNYGKCTDLYSPGVDILSTIPNGKTAVYSGTSMATPNLVGVVNHYLDLYPTLNMQQLRDKMKADATQDHMSGNPAKTNNLFVYLNRT